MQQMPDYTVPPWVGSLSQLGPMTPVASHQRFNEEAFLQWYAQQAAAQGLNPDPDDPTQFYDYRSAFVAGATPDQTGHWPSEFKLPGHPNLVVGGFDTRTGKRVPGTPQASEQELIKLGWPVGFARAVSRK